jgi:hypothetical protein
MPDSKNMPNPSIILLLASRFLLPVITHVPVARRNIKHIVSSFTNEPIMPQVTTENECLCIFIAVPRLLLLYSLLLQSL